MPTHLRRAQGCEKRKRKQKKGVADGGGHYFTSNKGLRPWRTREDRENLKENWRHPKPGPGARSITKTSKPAARVGKKPEGQQNVRPQETEKRRRRTPHDSTGTNPPHFETRPAVASRRKKKVRQRGSVIQRESGLIRKRLAGKKPETSIKHVSTSWVRAEKAGLRLRLKQGRPVESQKKSRGKGRLKCKGQR